MRTVGKWKSILEWFYIRIHFYNPPTAGHGERPNFNSTSLRFKRESFKIDLIFIDDYNVEVEIHFLGISIARESQKATKKRETNKTVVRVGPKESLRGTCKSAPGTDCKKDIEVPHRLPAIFNNFTLEKNEQSIHNPFPWRDSFCHRKPAKSDPAHPSAPYPPRAPSFLPIPVKRCRVLIHLISVIAGSRTPVERPTKNN